MFLFIYKSVSNSFINIFIYLFIYLFNCVCVWGGVCIYIYTQVNK